MTEPGSARAPGLSRAVRWPLYAVLALTAAVVPLFLGRLRWQTGTWWIGVTYTEPRFGPYERFELWGLTGSLLLAVVAAVEIATRRPRTLRELLPIALPLLVAFHFLGFLEEYSHRSFDYLCYQRAARTLREGGNPYEPFRFYMYPPVTAQVLAGVERWVEAGALPVYPTRDPREPPGSKTNVQARDAPWLTVFYLFQWCQWLLVLLAYALLFRSARGLGVASDWAHALTAALLLCNHPLLRTLRFGQVNLWVLDLSLAGILLAARRPVASGLAVAIAAHIKLYPLALLPGMWFARYRRAALGGVGCVAAIVLVQTDFGRDWQLWSQFLSWLWSALPSPEPVSATLRNNSLSGLLQNSLRALGADPEGALWPLRLGSAAAAAWALARFVARERAYRSADAATVPPFARLFAHASDALAFGLLLSPLVWEHHYLLATPLVVWAAATRGPKHPVAIGCAAMLMLWIPTFDVFPLSYHRMAGLVLLLLLTPPGRLPGRRVFD